MPAASLPTRRFEDDLRRRGIARIAGVDEAGRGALAGPVVAAAVVLPPGCRLPRVRDSKLVPEPERETLYDAIIGAAAAWSVGVIGSVEIDRINILQATFAAMRGAVAGLIPPPEFVLVDGRDAIETGIPCRAVIGGDALSLSIAAASIIAKVTRDRIMRDLDGRLPNYGFARHKGYGTAAHRAAILEHGPAEVHRRTFIGKILGLKS